MLTPIAGTATDFSAPVGATVIVICTVSGGTANVPTAQYNGFVLQRLEPINLPNGEFATGFTFQVVEGAKVFTAACLFTTGAPAGLYSFSELTNNGGIVQLQPLGSVINDPTAFPIFGMTIHA